MNEHFLLYIERKINYMEAAGHGIIPPPIVTDGTK